MYDDICILTIGYAAGAVVDIIWCEEEVIVLSGSMGIGHDEGVSHVEAEAVNIIAHHIEMIEYHDIEETMLAAGLVECGGSGCDRCYGIRTEPDQSDKLIAERECA